MVVKSVFAEDALSAHFDGLLRARAQAEVGLLVGLALDGKAASRAIVLAAVPPQEGDEVLSISAGGAQAAAPRAKKGGSGAKPKSSEPAVSIELETELLAEHALGVSRMLPGGLAVLGLYLFGPESGYASASGQLCATLAAIAADAAALGGGRGAAGGEREMLLLHVDSTSRKTTARSCLAASQAAAAGSLKPCELKFGPSLPSLVALRCSHSFALPLPAGAATAQLQSLLHEAAAAEAARVAAGHALLAGEAPASASQPVADLLPAGASASQPVRVDLFCPPACSSPSSSSSSSSGDKVPAASSAACAGMLRLAGCVEAVAVVHKRDAAAKAVGELKADIGRSLLGRLQLLADEALAAADEAAREATAGSATGTAPAASRAAHPLLLAAGAGKRVRCGLPSRVLLPWEGLGLQVCDYLCEGEAAAAAADRGRQLLHLASLQPGQVQLVEAPAVTPAKAVPAPPVGAPGSASCSAAALAASAAAAVAAAAAALAWLNLG